MAEQLSVEHTEVQYTEDEMSAQSHTMTSQPHAPRLLPSLIYAITNSTVGQVILGPILFISFLLSLSLVDQQESKAIFASQNSHTRSRATSASSSGSNKDEPFYHSHQKKMMRRALEDAFQLRGKVILGMGMVSGVGVGIAAWLGSKVWTFVYGY